MGMRRGGGGGRGGVGVGVGRGRSIASRGMCGAWSWVECGVCVDLACTLRWFFGGNLDMHGTHGSTPPHYDISYDNAFPHPM